MARAKKEVVEDKVVETVAANEAIVEKTVDTATEVATAAEKVQEDEIKAGEVVDAEDTVQVCSSDKVCIALNYPQNIQFEVMTGTPQEHIVEFYGNASYLQGKEMGILPLGAYGLTPNVDKEDWDWIQKNYKDMKMIRKGLLFAASANTVRDAARERKALRNGFEPVVKEVNNTTEQ